MKLNRLAAILLRQFYLYRGSFARTVPLFAWVAIDIMLWGFMTKFLGSISQSTLRPQMRSCSASRSSTAKSRMTAPSSTPSGGAHDPSVRSE